MSSDSQLLRRLKQRRRKGNGWTKQRPVEPTYSRLKLRQARQACGLKIEEAAALMGQSASFIRERELGTREIYLEDLRYFAKLYHQPIRYFRRSRSA